MERFDSQSVKILLSAAVAVLGVAYFFEFALGLAPCQLCLYQRLPWWLVIGICSLASVYRHRPHLRNILIILAAVTLFVGAGIAAYHVGVEQKWWAGPGACSATTAMPDNLADLKRAILAAPVVRCDEIAWSLFNISMAGYNAILSMLLGLYGLLAGIRLRQAC